MNQGRRAQRVPGQLAAEVAMGDTFELLVDGREEVVEVSRLAGNRSRFAWEEKNHQASDCSKARGGMAGGSYARLGESGKAGP
jgi:hypothetical protein